jgi:hypothetical protein
MSLQTSLQPPDNAHYDAVGSVMPKRAQNGTQNHVRNQDIQKKYLWTVLMPPPRWPEGA